MNPKRRAHRQRRIENRERIVASSGRKRVRNQARSNRRVTRFAHSNQHAEPQQFIECLRPTGQHRAQAPDEDAERDEPFARKAIPEETEERRRDEIADHEDRIGPADFPVGDGELTFLLGQHRRHDRTVDVIDQIEPGQNDQQPKGRQATGQSKAKRVRSVLPTVRMRIP